MTMVVFILLSAHTKICIFKGEPTSPVREKSDFIILILLLQNSFDSKEVYFRFLHLKGIILYLVDSVSRGNLTYLCSDFGYFVLRLPVLFFINKLNAVRGESFFLLFWVESLSRLSCSPSEIQACFLRSSEQSHLWPFMFSCSLSPSLPASLLLVVILLVLCHCFVFSQCAVFTPCTPDDKKIPSWSFFKGERKLLEIFGEHFGCLLSKFWLNLLLNQLLKCSRNICDNMCVM